MARFTVLLHPSEDGRFAAEVPGLGFVTDGDTVEHALAMAKEAAEGRIKLMVEDHDVIVPERVPPIIASIEVDVPASIDAWVDAENVAEPAEVEGVTKRVSAQSGRVGAPAPVRQGSRRTERRGR
jgi:predicted RNase H-like HicB family nuclease